MARCAKDRPALELANIVGATRRSFVKRSRRWRCRTRSSSTVCCFAPAPTRCWKWPATPSVSAPRSASSACCIAGIRSWNQKLEFHPHLHCIVAAGGLSPDHTRWIHPRYPFLLPVEVLSRVFRGKFVAALKRAHARGDLSFHGKLQFLPEPKAFRHWLRQLFRHNWVVYSKRPFGGPEHALGYLGCYTHRVAISNHRLVSFTDGKVTFRWRDSAHKNKKWKMTLPVSEFPRRFLLHTLPRGFVRIRHFGFLANRRRAELLPLCRQLLEAGSHEGAPTPAATESRPPATWRCPLCGGPMTLIERLTALQISWLPVQRRTFVDTS